MSKQRVYHARSVANIHNVLSRSYPIAQYPAKAEKSFKLLTL